MFIPKKTNTSPEQGELNSSLKRLDASLLADTEAISANPDGMTEVSAKMVEIAHQISIANANKAPMVTNIPAPGKDSVSALLARFFNARGDLYRVHTDRGADIGKRLSWSLKDGASKYADTDESGKKDFLSDRSGGRDAYVRRTGVHAPYNEDIPKGVPAPYTSDEDDGAGVFPRSEKHIFLSHSDDEYSD